MHVHVDKETAFISSLNAEGWPETINIKNTSNFFISAETIKPYFQVDRDFFFQKLHISNIIWENHPS